MRLDKWRMRRSEELRSGKRMVMTNMSLFLGSIFQGFGVTVHFSTADCDDTIAAFAYHLNGSVLSRDCDFFRYTTTSGELPFLVYRDFQMFGGESMLNKHNVPGHTDKCHRQEGFPLAFLFLLGFDLLR